MGSLPVETNRKILIVIPTYNEYENIENLLGRLLNMPLGLHVLVVDDNSPDGTGKLVEEISQRYNRIHILHRAKKEGIGPAYVAGFKWALEQGFDIVVEMDADLSHRPRYLPKMIAELETYDVVAGSRWIKGGSIANWAFWRVLLSRLANLYASFILHVPITDLTGGYNCYRSKVLRVIDLDSIHSDGYSFQIEMKYRSFQHGFRIKEIPITFPDRKAGDSKISKRIVLEAMWIVWKLKLTANDMSQSSDR